MVFIGIIGVLCYKLRIARCIVVLLGHKNDTVLALDNKINIVTYIFRMKNVLHIIYDVHHNEELRLFSQQ